MEIVLCKVCTLTSTDTMALKLVSFSTGSGDIDTSKVVKADADGCIQGASGWLGQKCLKSLLELPKIMFYLRTIRHL